jgi:hypothetical protein
MKIFQFFVSSVGLGLACTSVAWADNNCTDATDFLQIELRLDETDIRVASIVTAYPDISYHPETNTLVSSDGAEFEITQETTPTAVAALLNTTFGDQFRYIYPLEFDLELRQEPWFDPGRLRNTEFMSFLYFETEAAARDSLSTVESTAHGTTFQVTQKRNVACQLQAVLEDVSGRYPELFREIGGSFNWRVISGTDRLSSHSFGAAIDLNASLGGYWKWSGRAEGNVGGFDNKIPLDLVEAFERYGFIWGGKWHHYDGMHFEYRPELIIYARMAG